MKNRIIVAILLVVVVACTTSPKKDDQTLSGSSTVSSPDRKPASVGRGDRFGVNIHYADENAQNEVKKLGFEWIRVDMGWPQIEPTKGNFNWGPYDAQIEAARKTGIKIYANIGGTPKWAARGGVENAPYTATYEYKNFLKLVVSRYKDVITHWGIWNEPNLSMFWAGDLGEYINYIVRVGPDYIRSIDPNAKVLGPELSNLISGKWDTWFDSILFNAGDKFDIITHHMYENVDEMNRLYHGPKAAWEKPTIQSILEKNGQKQKEFWLTEFGWNTDKVTEKTQARRIKRFFEQVQDGGPFDKVFLFEMFDAIGMYRYGLFDSAGGYRKKAGYYAVKEVLVGGTRFNCPNLRKKLGYYEDQPVCQALPDLGVRRKKCTGPTWENFCLDDNGDWFRARHIK